MLNLNYIDKKNWFEIFFQKKPKKKREREIDRENKETNKLDHTHEKETHKHTKNKRPTKSCIYLLLFCLFERTQQKHRLNGREKSYS